MTRPRALCAHFCAAGITAAVKGRVIVLQWGGVALTFTDEGEGTTIALAPELLKAEMTRRAVRLRLAYATLAELPAAAVEALAKAEPGQEEATRRELLSVVAERHRSEVDRASAKVAQKDAARWIACEELRAAQAQLTEAQGIKDAVLAALEPTP